MNYSSLRILSPGIRDMNGGSDKAGKAVDVPPLDWEQRFEVFRIGWLSFWGEFFMWKGAPKIWMYFLFCGGFFLGFIMADLFVWRGKVSEAIPEFHGFFQNLHTFRSLTACPCKDLGSQKNTLMGMAICHCTQILLCQILEEWYVYDVILLSPNSGCNDYLHFSPPNLWLVIGRRFLFESPICG